MILRDVHVVDEMMANFDELEQHQRDSSHEQQLRAEDLAEDRIRIWVKATRMECKNALKEQAAVYEARIRALQVVSPFPCPWLCSNAALVAVGLGVSDAAASNCDGGRNRRRCGEVAHRRGFGADANAAG